MPQLICTPIGVDEANSAYLAINQPFSNAIGKYADNTDSYAEWTMVKGRSAYTYVLWTFDISSIPSNATIDKVTCTARCYNSNTQAFYAGNTSVSLLVGTESKVTTSGTKAFGNTPVEVTLTSSDYTREELDSFRLKIQSVRGYLGTNNTYYTRLYGATLTIEYEVPIVVPTITIGTPSREKISDESGYDECLCTFTSDVNLRSWEARATIGAEETGRGKGLLVESGGTLLAGQEGIVSVINDELSNGDGEYTIAIYGLSEGGVWSD